MNVVPFSGGSLQDIPTGLRNLADVIELGVTEGRVQGLTKVTALVWIALDAAGNTEAGALGANVDKYRAAGIAQAAMTKLTQEQTP